MAAEIKTDPKIKVLFATTEAAPYVKVGGLADVAGALPPTLTRLHADELDMRLIMPYHPQIKQKNLPVRSLGSFKLSTGAQALDVDLYVSSLEEVPLYLVDTRAIQEESAVYEGDPALDATKYVPFSLAILEACRFLGWVPDILHLNDWHTALAAYALKTMYKSDPLFAGVKTLLSVHNLPYNGYGAQPVMLEMGFAPSEDPELPEWARFTPLPLGIASSDKVVFVSKGYADEVLEEPMGSGLAEYLGLYPERLDGFVNGIDTELWDPMTDPKLRHPFSHNNLSGKALNKADFQEEYGFRVDERIPLLTVVSRLVNQKGIDIILDALAEIRDLPWQFAILGTGDVVLEQRIREMAVSMPERVAAILKYDDAIAHEIYASGDLYLMPSLYEPCGLSQMFAMRYGNIPVARATGGLRDSVTDYASSPEEATGFLFEGTTGSEMAATLREALILFKDKDAWSEIQKNAMTRDFSWNQASLAYWNLYRQLAA